LVPIELLAVGECVPRLADVMEPTPKCGVDVEDRMTRTVTESEDLDELAGVVPVDQVTGSPR
jgi:hypothetical protein